MANFPERIWNGMTASRRDLDVTTPPDHGDWVVLLDELQAMQEFLLALAGNVRTMPNLEVDLKEADRKVGILVAKMCELTPPGDLYGEVEALKRDVSAQDLRTEHKRVRNNVKRLLLRTRVLEKAYAKLKKDSDHKLDVLTNQYRNKVAEIERTTEERMAVLQEQITELQDVLQSPDLDD